ncbi:MAG: enoyl-CoA hydratase-related protein, partial [Sulfurimonas sp.]
MKYFNYKLDKKGVASITFDTPKSNANLFSSASISELNKQLDVLLMEKDIKLLLIQSAKEHIFIAGADINEIKTAKTEKEINDFVKSGQDLFTKLEKLPFATLA